MDVGELLARLKLDTSQFDSGLADTEGKATSFGSKLGGILTAGALAAAVGLGSALVGIGGMAMSGASEANQGVRDLQAQLGITQEAARDLGQEALEVFKNNFTGSISEAHEAIAEASLQLGEFVDPTQLGELASGALAVSDIFKADYPQVLNTARTLMDRFGLDGQQALDFITKGYQSGLNASGDFLDSVGEYSNLFDEGGFSADQFFSAMQTGMQGGVLGTDKIADAFKELGIRLIDGSQTTKDALSGLGLDEVMTGLRNGTLSVADAFPVVQEALAGIQDPIKQAELGVALFGTQWEDLGASALLGVSLTSTAMADMAGSTDSLNVKYESLSAVGETLWRRFQVALIPAGQALLDLANLAMPYVLAAFSWFETKLPGLIESAKAIIATMVAVVSGLFQGPLSGSLGSAQANFQTTRDIITNVMNAISSYVGAILGVVMAFWRQNGDSIKAFVNTTWTQISGIITTVMQIIQAIVVPLWTAIAGFISSNQTTIVAYFTNAWNGISALISGILGFISGILNAFLAAIKGDWTGAWEHIKQASASLVGGIWEFLKSAFENGKLVLTTVTNAIKDTLVNVWGNIKDSVVNKASEIWSGVKGKFDELKGNINGLAGDFLNVAANLGQNIIDGLVTGVKNGVGALREAVRNAATSALDAAKKMLGIQSPSKAFEYIGTMTMPGAAQGVIKSIPVLTSAVEQAAQAATSTFNSAMTNNYYLSARYANYQSESSLRDDVRTMQLLGAGV